MKEFIQVEITVPEFKNIISELIREELKNFNRTESSVNSFLTRQQAANLLSISLPTLHSYTQLGIIQAVRIGTRVLYRETDLKNAPQEITAQKTRR